jgi:prolipoprotein diacylglyceryltransferase
MLPVIVFGAWKISTYALLYTLAALVGGSLGFWRLRDAAAWRSGVLLTLAAIFLGLGLPSFIENHLNSLLTGQPAGPLQVRVYYGLGLGLLAFYVYCRARRLSVLKPLDRLVPAFALGYSLARLGCLAAGCCGGAETDSFLGMPAPNTQGEWADRYPTQLMSGGFQLFCGLLAMRFEDWRSAIPGWLRRDGLVLYAYLFLFALERFVLDFLREDYAPLWGAFSLSQALMAAAMLAALLGLVWQARLLPRKQS